MNDTNYVGGPGQWFTRDILRFKSLSEAMESNITSIDIVENGLRIEGLIPQYRTYSEMITEYKNELSQTPHYHDPYTIGSWLAGQLWQLNHTKGQMAVFAAILKLAITGEKFQSTELFLAAVEKNLGL